MGIITKTQGEGLFMQSLNAGCGVVIAIIIVGLIILIFNMP